VVTNLLVGGGGKKKEPLDCSTRHSLRRRRFQSGGLSFGHSILWGPKIVFRTTPSLCACAAHFLVMMSAEEDNLKVP